MEVLRFPVAILEVMVALDNSNYLPNENAAARFLSQASIGFNPDDIQEVAATGVKDKLETQMQIKENCNSVRDFIGQAKNQLDKSCVK